MKQSLNPKRWAIVAILFVAWHCAKGQTALYTGTNLNMDGQPFNAQILISNSLGATAEAGGNAISASLKLSLLTT